MEFIYSTCCVGELISGVRGPGPVNDEISLTVFIMYILMECLV